MNGDFIDTNIFAYLVDETDDRKRSIATRVVMEGVTSGATISYQVVQETLNLFIGKLARSARIPDADEFLRNVLEPMWTVMPSPALYQRALQIHRQAGFSFFDSLIVAAALQAGCARLLTEDMQQGQRIDGLVIVNPFV
jgi:predicted nucleic acid-binding protein